MKTEKMWGCLLIGVICCVTEAFAGGMVDVLGTFETYTEELAENRVLHVGDTELLLLTGSAVSYYLIGGTRTDMLYQGQLAADATISVYGIEIVVPAPNVVWFYESGDLKYTSEIAEPTAFLAQGRLIVFDHRYNVYTPLGFHNNGHVYQGNLFEPTALSVQNRDLVFGGRVVFSEDGALIYGRFDEDAHITVQRHEWSVTAGDDASFYEDGTVKEIGLPEGRVSLQAGRMTVGFTSQPRLMTRVLFHPNGSVMLGCLAEDTVFTVQGREATLVSGTLVRFTEDGSLESAMTVDGTVIFTDRGTDTD